MMKKLGLIGGTGPESTIPYYRGIVFGVQKQLGKPFFPNLTIESLDVFQVLEYCRRDDYAGLTNYVSQGFVNLAHAGCEFAALTGNTPHIVFDALQERSPIPLVSMPAAACAEACRLGYHRLGLLGTIFTMKKDFFKKPFADAGIDVVIPREDEMAYIEKALTDELELGIVRPQTQQALLAIVQRLADTAHIDAVILGCTELPLAFQGLQTPVPVLDTMAIHIQRLITMIVND